MCSNTPVYCHVVVVLDSIFIYAVKQMVGCVCVSVCVLLVVRGRGEEGWVANWAFFGIMNRAFFFPIMWTLICFWIL